LRVSRVFQVFDRCVLCLRKIDEQRFDSCDDAGGVYGKRLNNWLDDINSFGCVESKVSMTTLDFKLGDYIDVILEGPQEANLWRASTPLGGLWIWFIRLRRSDRSYQPGQQVAGWVATISRRNNSVYLHDSDYGRLPVSRRMRPRYLRALRAVISMFDAVTIGKVELPDKETLSDFRGMLGGCAKTDTADWFTLFQAFGLSNGPQAVWLYHYVIELQRLIQQGDDKAIRLALQDLTIRLAEHVQAAEATLKAENEILLPETTLRTFEPSRPRGVDRRVPDSSAIHQTHRASRSTTLDLIARRKLAWANRTHVRSAISQLYEYRYIHELKQAKLCIVLSTPPPEQWIIPYLEEDRSIHLCWLSLAGGFDGPGWHLLFNISV
jgi:hypothetical protein